MDDITLKQRLDELLGSDSDEENQDHELDQILGKEDQAGDDKKEKVRVPVYKVTKYSPSFSLPSSQEKLFVKTPAVLRIESRPFDVATHDKEMEKRLFKGVSDVIRHRRIQDYDGKDIVQSNARLVKWDDGTMQLIVGKSIYDVKVLEKHNCYVFERQYAMVQQIEPVRVLPNEKVAWTYVGQSDKLIKLQPSSLQSETHARFAQGMYQRHVKQSRMKIVDSLSMENPAVRLAEIIRTENEVQATQRQTGKIANSGCTIYSSYSRVGKKTYASGSPSTISTEWNLGFAEEGEKTAWNVGYEYELTDSDGKEQGPPKKVRKGSQEKGSDVEEDDEEEEKGDGKEEEEAEWDDKEVGG